MAAATQIVEILEAVKSNVQGAATLSDHVSAVMLVVVTSLKGKTTKGIPEDLLTNLGRLHKDLLSILADVKRIQKRVDTTKFLSMVKAIVKYGDNASMITDCNARLEWMSNRIQDLHEDVQDT
ncbi:hypothetical protein FRB97_005458 [Tulasnella sp. 331]|nr:hypothetical protein FRB97_005458 [Tulasnella sp. 331]KAG8879818.1 hypothetical protein FRB98_005503 [Tulasnella sp. 332]